MHDDDRLRQLILQVADGDRHAFRRLYGRRAARLFGICGHLAPDPQTAATALVQSYCDIWHEARDFPRLGLGASDWMMLVARRAAIAPSHSRQEQGNEDAARIAACLDGRMSTKARRAFERRLRDAPDLHAQYLHHAQGHIAALAAIAPEMPPAALWRATSGRLFAARVGTRALWALGVALLLVGALIGLGIGG